MSAKLYPPAFPDDDVVGTLNVGTEVRRTEALLKTGALQTAIFNSANFSSIATDDVLLTAAPDRQDQRKMQLGTHVYY